MLAKTLIEKGDTPLAIHHLEEALRIPAKNEKVTWLFDWYQPTYEHYSLMVPSGQNMYEHENVLVGRIFLERFFWHR